jgi:hypothetical protein
MAFQGVDAPGGKVWVTGEYLLWWLRGDRLPPLVTTSPAGTPVTAAGVLGAQGTQILFGDERVNGDARSGGRVTAGCWLDNDCRWGIEGSFFALQGLTDDFGAQSHGVPILARPFLNTTSGLADSELVAFPGILAGSVTASERSHCLIGAEALIRKNLLTKCCDLGEVRLDALAGYRFLYLDETLAIQENLITTGITDQVPVGTTFAVRDQFTTRNAFDGGELGLAVGLRGGPCTLDVIGKVALGANSETVSIHGSTATALPGGPVQVFPGGLLALSSNSGHHTESSFSCVPELDVNLGYWITSHLRLTAGYTFLYWTDIVRPGKQIDLGVNPNLLPPVLPGGQLRPAFSEQRTSLWAQGLSVGLEFRY